MSQFLQESSTAGEAGGSRQIQRCHEDGNAMGGEDGRQGGSIAHHRHRTGVPQATDGTLQGLLDWGSKFENIIHFESEKETIYCTLLFCFD